MLLANVFKDFPNTYLGIYKIHLVCFLTALGLSWQASLAKTKLTGVNMYLMVEKVIWGEIFHGIRQHVKTNNKYMKDYDKNEESSYLKL